jgi:hypothetical protein
MKKIVRLTESDLARIVKRVISEGMDEVETDDTFDFSQTEKKLFDRFLTEKNGFEHIGTKGDAEAYVLKRRGFALVLMVTPSNDPANVYVKILIKLPMGKIINYLNEVQGKIGMEFKMNDYNGLVRQLQGAVNFGKSQHEYDTLPPLK